MSRQFGSEITFSENSGSPIAELHGVVGSGRTAWYANVADSVLTGIYSDLATGSGTQSLRYAPALGTPNVSGNAGTKSPEQVKFEDRRERLISAVFAMKQNAPNWSGIASAVREESANSAAEFLRCLPGNAILPRVAPDGEGDVMFVWDDQGISCIVTVEGRALHLVSKPGTASAHHVGPQQFLGFSIPSSILAYIPRK